MKSREESTTMASATEPVFKLPHDIGAHLSMSVCCARGWSVFCAVWETGACTRGWNVEEAGMGEVFFLFVWCGRRQAHSHSTINYDVELPHEGAIKEGQ